MTADTETIRAGLEMLPNNAGEEWCRANAAALAALGRVEEREREMADALQSMLTAIENYADPSAVPVTGKPTRKLIPSLNLRVAMRLAELALSSAAGGGEQEQDSGRAGAVSSSRERQTEGGAEE